LVFGANRLWVRLDHMLRFCRHQVSSPILSPQVSSLESAMTLQKGLGAGLQAQINALVATEEEQRQALGATSEALRLATLEVAALQSRAEERGRLLEDSQHKLSALEEQAAASETKAGELKEECEVAVNAFQPFPANVIERIPAGSIVLDFVFV